MLATLVVWLGLTVLFLLFTLLDELGPGAGGVRFLEIITYVLLTAPRSAYMVFPVSALLGALIGIGGLAASNELVALRTAGMSRLRIAGSVLGALGILTLGVMALGEWVAPAAEAQARLIKHARATGQGVVGADRGIWIRDGDQFFFAEKPLVTGEDGASDYSMHNVLIYSFADGGRLDGVTFARSARHEADGWVLEDSRRTNISPDGITRDFQERRPWQSSIKPDLLESVVLRPRYMSLRALSEQLDFLGRNGLDDRVYRSAFWTKALFPVTVLALVLAGMPFVFGSARQNTMGLRIFIGMAVGTLFTIFSRTMENFADAYDMPVIVGTALPAMLLAVVVVLVLRRSV
ncbi:MAG: LPS export ABC transporter permease LptG [Gammaproteobacteria bacterium]